MCSNARPKLVILIGRTPGRSPSGEPLRDPLRHLKTTQGRGFPGTPVPILIREGRPIADGPIKPEFITNMFFRSPLPVPNSSRWTIERETWGTSSPSLGYAVVLLHGVSLTTPGGAV